MTYPTHVRCPEGVNVRYLKPGKVYAVVAPTSSGFRVVAEDGYQAYCLWEDCAHLATFGETPVHRNWIPCGADDNATASALDEALDLLAEAADLLDDTAHGHYTPDSFSSQPARVFLAKHGRGVQS